MMLPVTLLRELDFAAPESPPFLSAASGLVVTEAAFVVVADDDLNLAVFPRQGGPGVRRRVLPGKLPAEPAERKARKPDFEALVRLPPFRTSPDGALLALGSGSSPRRARAALVPLQPDGTLSALSFEVFDFSNLYAALREELPELNLEGAVVSGDRLLLFQRGNGRRAENAIAELELPAVLRCFEEGREVDQQVLRKLIRVPELGEVEGVPLGFTDATVRVDGTILFAAVAEDTVDPYLDGRCLGSALGILDAELRVTELRRLEGPWKVEGVAVDPRGGNDLYLVADADDPSKPAPLLSTTWA